MTESLQAAKLLPVEISRIMSDLELTKNESIILSSKYRKIIRIERH